ncbi:MAG: O-antigen ligase family protein [Planctomycetota bacterium]|nr:O-antigen ligase family protein [Planctomycetota bacterium]
MSTEKTGEPIKTIIRAYMKETTSGQIEARVIVLFVSIFIIALLLGSFVTKVRADIVLAAVVGIALFILCFLSVKYSLYALIFAMLLSPQFGERTTEGGGITIRLDDFMLIIISFAWFARTAIYKEMTLLKKTPLNRPIGYYTLACIVATGFGMMFGKVHIARGFFFVFKYIEYFVVYFMAVNLIDNRKQLRNFTIALLVVFVIVCLTSIAQIPQGERITAPFEGKGGEPNTLGGYLLLMLSIVTGLLLNTDKDDSMKYKFLLLSLIFFAFIPIGFSQSRGTWFSLLPWYITFLVISKKKAVLGISLAIVVIVSPAIMPKPIKERFMYTFEKQKGWAAKYQEHVGGVTLDTSTSERLTSTKFALEAYVRHPVFGYGVTGWRFLDQQYLKTLVETGVFGFMSLLYLLYVLLRETRKVYTSTEDKFHKGIAMGFFAGIIAMMTHAIGANTFIIVRIMEPFWFLAAIVVSIPQIYELEKFGDSDSLRSEIRKAGV